MAYFQRDPGPLGYQRRQDRYPFFWASTNRQACHCNRQTFPAFESLTPTSSFHSIPSLIISEDVDHTRLVVCPRALVLDLANSSIIVDMSVDSSPYNYIPSRTVAIIMLTHFGLSTGNVLNSTPQILCVLKLHSTVNLVIHAGQATRYRLWWLLPTACFCGIIELIGWSGRLWSSFSPLASTPFQIE